MRIRQSRKLPFGTRFLIGAFTLSGTAHVLKPSLFFELIPPALGSPLFWTVSSGILELVCAFALYQRYWWAPYLTTAALAIVWVGNWWMAISLFSEGVNLAFAVAALRLPLQIPMMIWAWRSPTR